MIGLIVLALLCGGVSAGSHSLRYFYTAMTPIPGLPEFVSVGYVDDAEFTNYDSDRKRVIPRQRWMENLEDPDYWERETQILLGWEQMGKVNIQIAMTRTNQTGGIHTLQLMSGCELRADGSTDGFFQYGWDGKDLISLDKERMVWVTPVTWGVKTKNKWDQNRGMTQGRKGYLEGICIEWLNKYLKAGERELKPVAPQVFPSVNKASPIRPSELSCLVTGFYPRDIEVTLLKNGEPIKDTESSGILPNHDGTYQLLRWAQIELGDGATYSCQYDQGENTGTEIRDWGSANTTKEERRGVPKEVGNQLVDGTFRLTPGSPEGTNLGMVVGIVIGAVALIALVIGAVVWKRRGGEKKSGYSQANPAERGESSSNSSAQA